MSAGYISNWNPCPSELKLKSSRAVTQPRVRFDSFKLWATASLPPAPTGTPVPRAPHTRMRAHTDTRSLLGHAVPVLTTTQPHSQQDEFADPAEKVFFLFCRPASQLPPGSVVPPGPPCQHRAALPRRHRPPGRLPSTGCEAAPWYSFQTGAWERCHPTYLFQGGGG